VPVGPPASLQYNINNPTSASETVAPPTSPTTKGAKGKVAKEPEQKHMKLSLWDTAGQETYKSITRSYFRGASGALLVFDITRRSTFSSVTAWLNDLRQIAEDDIVVVLVGNKSDLAEASTVYGDETAPNRRQVTRQEAEQWCKDNKCVQYGKLGSRLHGCVTLCECSEN
jgi:small GTP-binding protein